MIGKILNNNSSKIRDRGNNILKNVYYFCHREMKQKSSASKTMSLIRKNYQTYFEKINALMKHGRL